MLHQVSYGANQIPYEVIRKDRKTVGIVVEPTGTVKVKAPLDLSDTKVQDIVDKKKDWIAKKIAKTQQIKKPVPKIQEPVSGESILYKNTYYKLLIHKKAKKSEIKLIGRNLNVYVHTKDESQLPGKVKELLIEWYKEKSYQYLEQRITRFAPYLGVQPKELQIRELKNRWGSCTGSENLIFNWRLIMAPISVIDYIVIHELTHLKEPNHSEQFWLIIESILPSYKKWKDWLFFNGLSLDLRW